MVGTNEPRAVSGTGPGAQPRWTVGSLLGVPLGAEPAPVPVPPPSHDLGRAAVLAAPVAATAPALVEEEGPWTIARGAVGGGDRQPAFRGDGVEALTYDNPFGQAIEQAWFDGKLVYAVDLGEVEVDPSQVKVAQEYQIVYDVALDARGKLASEPRRPPGQLNIYDSVPGMAQYSPIWQFNYVVVPGDYRPNTLRSEHDCLASGYPIHRSHVFEN